MTKGKYTPPGAYIYIGRKRSPEKKQPFLMTANGIADLIPKNKTINM